jgi:hypothetical protein
MPEKASQTDATTVTLEVGQLTEALSLTAEQVQRDPVYVRIPTSSVVPQPLQLFGPQIDGGQMPPQLIEWNQAETEMNRLMGLQMEPALTIDDVLPAQTIESAFAGSGVLGARSFGQGGYKIYPYAVLAYFGATLDPPLGWPPVSALVIQSSSGTIICRDGQLLVKGYSGAD